MCDKTGKRRNLKLDNARLLISYGKRQIFASKQEQEQKRKIVFFLDVDHVFRGTQNGEWNGGKRLEKKKLQEELAKKNKRGVQALDEERLKFFSSLTNKIKNLLQNKIPRPTK